MYDRLNFRNKENVVEKIVIPSQNTSYSIYKQAFNPNFMVQICMISDLNHGIDFESKKIEQSSP